MGQHVLLIRSVLGGGDGRDMGVGGMFRGSWDMGAGVCSSGKSSCGEEGKAVGAKEEGARSSR